MADSSLSLLFRLKASNEASSVVKAAQSDIAKLRSSFGSDAKQIESAATRSLGAVTQSLTQISSHIPVVGTGISNVASQFGSLTSTATGAAGSLSIVAGVAVLATAAIGGTLKALFDITKQAADFQGKMFDLSQQVGVSVETLSTLEILAQQTGGSIDGITASLGIFQKGLEEAQDASTKQAKLFKELGVETKNTEAAFRQTLAALARMPEGFRQTATALEIFGRGGKAVLAVLKETSGDLDAATEKFRAMGVLITTDVARAADKFNDQLGLLGFQFRAITAIIAAEAMPTILSAMERLSDSISNNREAIGEWVNTLFDAGRGAVFLAENITGLIPLLRNLGNIFPAEGSTLSKLFQATPLGGGLTALAALGQLTSGPFRGVTGGVGSTPELQAASRSGGGGGKGRARANTELQAALKEAALAEKEAAHLIQENVEENKRALEEQVRDIEAFTERAKDLSDQRLNLVIDRVNAENEALETALRKKLITQNEYHLKDRELTLQVNEAIAKNSQEHFDLDQERDRKISTAESAARERQLQIAEEADQRQIGRIKDRIDRELLLESEGLRQVQGIIEEAFVRRKKALEEEQVAYATTAERRAGITDELVRLEGQRAGAAEDASRRVISAIEKEARARFDAESKGFGDATRPRRIFNDPNGPGAIDQLFKAINDQFSGDTQTAALAGLEAITTAFSGLANAVGQAVEAFVLYGSAGTSVRKVTAQILASVAQMAAVKAIFELAEGFAALALAYFGIPNAGPSASAHFAAAAIYGSIAGVAAVAGRAVAGNEFNKGSSGSGGGSGGNGPQQLNPLTLPRNQPTTVHHVVEIRVDDSKFGQAVTGHLVQEYTTTGPFREMIMNDGNV